jgi:membrane glycosyltransferase
LRHNAVQRSQARRVERVHKAGTARFTALCLTILATAVIVTWVMFQVLAAVAS